MAHPRKSAGPRSPPHRTDRRGGVRRTWLARGRRCYWCCCGRRGASASVLRCPAPTPFAFEQGGQTGAVWSPDGKAVAFGARQKDTDPFQVYVRYLDSPVATPITHLAVGAIPIDWTSTGRSCSVRRRRRRDSGRYPRWAANRSHCRRWIVNIGRPASVSRDGTALAWLRRGDDGVLVSGSARRPARHRSRMSRPRLLPERLQHAHGEILAGRQQISC